MKRWTKEEREYLLSNYPEKSYNELASSLGRSPDSIWRQLNTLGLSGAALQKKHDNKQSFTKIGCKRRANNKYNQILARTRGYNNPKSASYKNVEVKVSRSDFIAWYMPKDFDGASVDRIDKNGNYELSNMQVIPLSDNIAKDKRKAHDGLCACYRCGETKPLSEFIKDSRSWNGYSCICRSCERIRSREKYRRIKTYSSGR